MKKDTVNIPTNAKAFPPKQLLTRVINLDPYGTVWYSMVQYYTIIALPPTFIEVDTATRLIPVGTPSSGDPFQFRSVCV